MKTPGRLVMALVCAAAVLPGLGSAAGSAPKADDAARLVMAKVNGESLTLADLRDSFAGRHEGHGGLLVGEEILRSVLTQAVQERLLIQEGRRMGIPEERGFRQAVAAFEDTLRLEELERLRLREASAASSEDVRAAYQLLGRLMHIAIIETRDRKLAGEAAFRLSVGEEFDALARRVSVHQSRSRGGDLGWVSWGALDPASEAVALATPVGRTSDPFAAGGAWRILRVIEERKGEPPPLQEVEGKIRAIIEGRRLDVARAKLIASIRAAHPPVEDAVAIRTLLSGPPGGLQDAVSPPDGTVLLRTASGLEITAGHVRHRAARAGLAIPAAWDQAVIDTLLFDEARRSVAVDASMRRKLRTFEDTRVREQVEAEIILKDLRIADDEVRRYWEAHKGLFTGPSSFHMRHIVVADRAEAEEILKLLAAGEDFSDVAKRRSRDTQTAASGGDMGWVDGPGPVEGAALEGVFALKPGELSGPVRTTLGWSIVQMIAIRPPAARTFEQDRHAAAQRLTIQKQHDARAAVVEKLRSVSTIRIDDAALARAVALQDALAAGTLATPGKGGGR